MGSQGRRGQIIFLNGTSSSGKSSIAGQLLLMLDPPHCAPAELERRERERGDRTPGAALAQEPLVHAHGLYDVECDTTAASPYDCAVRIRDFLRTGQVPTAFDRLRSQPR
jgi:chloramphenicol 3-O-phosphotransferase